MKLTAKPCGNGLTTRPTQAPTASGIPICGCTSAETATPVADMSMTKQLRVEPSAKVRIECELAGMIRACFLDSRTAGSFCLLSSQVSLVASFSRMEVVMASSSRKLPEVVSLMCPSSLPKSPK